MGRRFGRIIQKSLNRFQNRVCEIKIFMEDDLIKKGILKEGEIQENQMINSPEKFKKIPSNIVKTFLAVCLVIIVFIVLFLIWFYLSLKFGKGSMA